MKKTLYIILLNSSFLLSNAQIAPTPDNPCEARLWNVNPADLLFTDCIPEQIIQNAIIYNNATLTGGIPNPSCIASNAQNIRDVWMRCTVPASGRLVIRIAGGSSDFVMAAYSRTGPCNTGTYNEVGCNNDYLGNINPRLQLSGLTPSTELYIRIFNNPISVIDDGLFYICITDYFDNLPVVDNSSKVGIGASSPYAKLDVAGTGIFRDKTQFAKDVEIRGRTKISGALNVDSLILRGAGFPGEFLTSDFNGLATWQSLPTGASVWNVSGNNINNNNTGNIGIGNSDPSYILDLSKRIRLRSENTSQGAGIWFNNNNNSSENIFFGNDGSNNLQVYSQAGTRTIASFNPNSGGLRVEGPIAAASGNTVASFGGNGDFLVDKPGFVGGRLTIKENGNVGFGTNGPNFPLSFGNTIGSKISFWDNGSNNYGIGMQGGLLQIHAAVPTDDIAFGTGSSAAFTERFRIKGNGALSVNGNTGSVGQVLTSNGDAAAGYTGLSSLTSAVGNSNCNTTYFIIPNNLTTITCATLNINIADLLGAKLLISGMFTLNNSSCTGSGCVASAAIQIHVDGVYVTGFFQSIGSGRFENLTISNLLYNVGPGNHTITFVAQVPGGGNTNSYQISSNYTSAYALTN